MTFSCKILLRLGSLSENPLSLESYFPQKIRQFINFKNYHRLCPGGSLDLHTNLNDEFHPVRSVDKATLSVTDIDAALCRCNPTGCLVHFILTRLSKYKQAVTDLKS